MALLPEDSWAPDKATGEYEVESIQDVRWVKKSRTSWRTKEYLIKWRCYKAVEWITMKNLSCDRLMHDFDKEARAKTRFHAMQSADEGEDADQLGRRLPAVGLDDASP